MGKKFRFEHVEDVTLGHVAIPIRKQIRAIGLKNGNAYFAVEKSVSHQRKRFFSGADTEQFPGFAFGVVTRLECVCEMLAPGLAATRLATQVCGEHGAFDIIPLRRVPGRRVKNSLDLGQDLTPFERFLQVRDTAEVLDGCVQRLGQRGAGPLIAWHVRAAQVVGAMDQTEAFDVGDLAHVRLMADRARNPRSV